MGAPELSRTDGLGGWCYLFILFGSTAYSAHSCAALPPTAITTTCCVMLSDTRSPSVCGYLIVCRILRQSQTRSTKNLEGGWTGFVVAFPFFSIRRSSLETAFQIIQIFLH